MTRAQDLRLVNLYSAGEDKESHIVPKGDLKKFIAATLGLRYKPGINPHNGNKPIPVEKITIQRMESHGRFWWTTPNLENNDDRRGAEIWNWSLREETVWDMVHDEVTIPS